VAIFLYVGATSGRVGDDRIHIGALEHIDRFACQYNGVGFFTGMHQQRSAAGLVLGSDDFAALSGQYAYGGSVYFREEFTLDAAEQ